MRTGATTGVRSRRPVPGDDDPAEQIRLVLTAVVAGILQGGDAEFIVPACVRFPDLKHGVARATYFAWKAKYANATISELTRLRELEQENARLKRMYADLALENTAIKDVLNRRL